MMKKELTAYEEFYYLGILLFYSEYTAYEEGSGIGIVI